MSSPTTASDHSADESAAPRPAGAASPGRGAAEPVAAHQPRPTFLFIGADRCGSKSLHNMFRQHPQCFVPPLADPYFFDKHYDRGIEWYWNLFAAAPKSALAIGEFSHDYIHSPEAARRIAKHLPAVKIMATLRHPIDRTWSSYVAAFNAGMIRTPFEQALDETPMLINYSLYADDLAPYFELFPRDHVKILFFDDLEANPRAFAAQAFEFLGLPIVEGIDYEKRMSVLSKPRFPLAGYIRKGGANALRRLGWVNLLGRLKSSKFRSLFVKPYNAEEKPRIPDATRRRLREVFAPQIDRLEQMLGRDLSGWRE